MKCINKSDDMLTSGFQQIMDIWLNEAKDNEQQDLLNFKIQTFF